MLQNSECFCFLGILTIMLINGIIEFQQICSGHCWYVAMIQQTALVSGTHMVQVL
ncbi:hypothetical protein GLYMA_08G091100v4 [Glycine max]|uniref:Uncharacterized protein n=1 Tax=Glycine max TaxID=3847 RepID=A0A0R0IJ99_SOYBN|nr:hypothetical protein GYH30_020704 [Glycine max]KRH42462.1 hypothetical protein GLYMA_08G091100v4 [Glycine max]